MKVQGTASDRVHP